MNIRKSVSKSARNKYFIGAQRWRKRTFIFLPFIAVEEKCFGYFFFFCEGSEALVLWFGFSLHAFRTGLDGWGQKQRLMWSFALYCVFLRRFEDCGGSLFYASCFVLRNSFEVTV